MFEKGAPLAIGTPLREGEFASSLVKKLDPKFAGGIKTDDALVRREDRPYEM